MNRSHFSEGLENMSRSLTELAPVPVAEVSQGRSLHLSQ